MGSFIFTRPHCYEKQDLESFHKCVSLISIPRMSVTAQGSAARRDESCSIVGTKSLANSTIDAVALSCNVAQMLRAGNKLAYTLTVHI